ncbi:MAG: hypothetical protein P8Z00_05980 [Anaerolineales bacterium]
MKSLLFRRIVHSMAAYWLLTALLVASQGSSLPAKASPSTQTIGSTEILANPPRVIYVAGDVPEGSAAHLMAPPAALDPNAPQLSTINVKYVGNWPSNAKNAFEYAKHIWEVTLNSPVTIVVSATWETLGPYVLGSTGPHDAIRFTGTAPGGAMIDTWYPIALADKLGGKDYNGSAPEIVSSFNSAFSNCPGFSNCWYFGTDGKPGSNQFDFASVVLHELAHGLGFAGSMEVNGGIGQWGSQGYPFIFDLFAVNGQNQKLTDTNIFKNGSTALGDQLTSNQVYFDGAHAVAANGGQEPKLYAPSTWQQGSSFSHLDEATYSAGSLNALMTPVLNPGEVEQVPGPITRGIFQDIGWGVQNPTLPPRAYLPLLSNDAGGKLFGQVTENGSKAPNVPLTLCRLNSPTDTHCTSMRTTTTIADGTYAFNNLPALQTGQKYFAYFKNTTNTKGRLWYWQTHSLVTYTFGSQVQLGNFDIEDIKLISPTLPVTVTLPVTFSWKVRSASPSDSYEFDLYEPQNGSTNFYTKPPLGHVGSYRLKSLPSGFLMNQRYVWEVWAYAPDNAFGISLEARPVAFASSASPPTLPVETHPVVKDVLDGVLR